MTIYYTKYNDFSKKYQVVACFIELENIKIIREFYTLKAANEYAKHCQESYDALFKEIA